MENLRINNTEWMVASPYGQRPPILVNGVLVKGFHDGIDLVRTDVPTIGQDWYSLADGVVKYAQADRFGGKFVLIKHDDGSGHWSLHHSELLVSPGQRIKKFDVVARCGSSGLSMAPHVHVTRLLNADDWNSHTNPYEWVKEVGIVLEPPITIIEGDKSKYVVNGYGLPYIWVWNVVEELLHAGLWSGLHTPELDNKFYSMNNPTPQGGYKAGDVVNI